MSNPTDKIKKYFAMQKEAFAKHKEAEAVLSGGPASYYFDKVAEYSEALFERFAPFEIGDKVKIYKEIDIDNASGWNSCRHFLIVDAIGEVMDVDYRGGKFTADVMFDDESWINSHTKKVTPVEGKDRHTFCLSERFVKKVLTRKTWKGKINKLQRDLDSIRNELGEENQDE